MTAERIAELREHFADERFNILAVSRSLACEALDALKAALEDLDWIACASRDEIEEMLKDSVCDDVDDMRRFIREARLAQQTVTEGRFLCRHDRLNEDGVCRMCGTDRRGI